MLPATFSGILCHSKVFCFVFPWFMSLVFAKGLASDDLEFQRLWGHCKASGFMRIIYSFLRLVNLSIDSMVIMTAQWLHANFESTWPPQISIRKITILVRGAVQVLLGDFWSKSFIDFVIMLRSVSLSPPHHNDRLRQSLLANSLPENGYCSVRSLLGIISRASCEDALCRTS
jgi:hypothetical protein